MILISGCSAVKLGDDDGEKVSGSIVEGTENIQAGERETSIITNAVRNVVRDVDCIGVEIDLIEIGGKKEPCVYKNTITLQLINEGEKGISGVNLHIKGDKSDEIVVRLEGLSVGSASNNIVRYDEERYGSLEELEIAPIIVVDDKEGICSGKTIKYDGVGSC